MAVLFAAPIEQYPAHLAFVTVPTVSPAAVAGYPASRLVNYDPTLVFMSTTGNSAITWDFGSARQFDLVSLVYTNATYGATWTVEGSANGTDWTVLRSSVPLWAHLSAAPGAGPFTEDNHPARFALERNLSFWKSATVQSWRYLRVSVTDAGNPGLTIGRLFVGKCFTPATGLQYGSSFSFQSSGRRERTDKGALVLEDGRTIVTVNAKMDFLTATEMYDYVWQFNYWRRDTREMFACLDDTDIPRLQKNCLYCTITEGRQINFDAFNQHSQSWILESIA